MVEDSDQKNEKRIFKLTGFGLWPTNNSTLDSIEIVPTSFSLYTFEIKYCYLIDNPVEDKWIFSNALYVEDNY